LRLVCQSNTHVFDLSQLEILIGTLEFSSQIWQFWNLKPAPSGKQSILRSLERWNGGGRGSRSNPKKLEWTCELERPVEMLLHTQGNGCDLFCMTILSEHLYRGSKLDQIQSKTSRWLFFSPTANPNHVFGWIRLGSNPKLRVLVGFGQFWIRIQPHFMMIKNV
jgi:hypothetical protein